MMPSRAWARASAASMSRYFWMRFSSAKMRRIGSVEKISRKIPKLTPTAVMDVSLPKRRPIGTECARRGPWRAAAELSRHERQDQEDGDRHRPAGRKPDQGAAVHPRRRGRRDAEPGVGAACENQSMA